MTGDRRMLSDYIPGSGPKITFGDNSKGTTMGKEFQRHTCIVKDQSGLIIMIGERSGNTYKVCLKSSFQKIKCVLPANWHEYSATRTPQQNGVAERRNRTLKEAARTMIADSGISQKFWAESVNTACYTQNRSMINKKVEKTPYEIWYGKVPVISYFKVFGCKYFILNNGKTHLTALDVRSDADIFLGYSSVSKEYREFNTKSLTVEESVHIVFHETSITNESPSLNDLSNIIEDSNLDTDDEEEIQIIQNREILCEPDQVEEQRPEEPPVDNEIPMNTDLVQHLNDQTQQGNTDHHYRWSKTHPPSLVIGNPSAPLRTRCQMINEFKHAAFISHIEPIKIEEALFDSNWIEAMQDELNQFDRNSVWHLVPRPSDKSIIGTRWVFM
ncbi:uncharacterized protein [Henckelia pumila]|uniref:uncharacterized protein n=1 Tax=Henckelia pumila TaxID=405737 RepID=UPI003C6E33D4